MTAALLARLSTPLKGYVDPPAAVVNEVAGVVARLRAEIEAFDPELVFLFAPDHYNGFFPGDDAPACLGGRGQTGGRLRHLGGPPQSRGYR